MPDEVLKEKIVFELDASGVKGNSLSGLIAQLEQVEAHVNRVNTALNGMKGGSGAARGFAELQAEIQKMQSKGGTLKVGELTKALNLDQAEFERFLARQKSNLKDYQSTLQQFRSAPSAARAIAQYERQAGAGQVKLADLLRPPLSTVHGPQSTVGKVEGKIALEIPASQVQASVVGAIQLNVPGNQVAGGGLRDPETGKFLSGGGRRRGGGKQPLDIPLQPGELQRVRTDAKDSLKEAITAVDEAGKIVTTVHDSIEGLLKTSTKTKTGASPIEQFRQARRVVEERFKQAKTEMEGGARLQTRPGEKGYTPPMDTGYALAALQKKQGEQLLGLLQQPFMKQVSGPQRQAITKLVEEQALTLEARSIETFQAAQQASRDLYYRGVFARFTNQVTPPQGMTPVQRKSYQAAANQLFGALPSPGRTGQYRGYGLAGRFAPGAYGLQPALPQLQVPAPTPAYAGPVPPKIKPPTAPVSPFARGLKAFTPTGFAANLLNVTGWAAAVGTLYKSLELASYSLSRFVDIGQQTARLSVVFRGVGGSAKQLTDDVLQLAAANGRDTEEAMTSATEWSRLGLTRVQVNEAVRVSLEAANVAGMHAGETTKQLASLMHIYNLEVGDLEGVLGMLTTTSQRYNVTLEDLFQGLDRAAGSAKLGKVGLAELQALIGTVVGKTGQSGTVVGNTIKSMLVQFSNPDVQQYLRRFGIETLTKEGGQKSGSQILQEMFTKWQGLDDRNKQSLMFRLVGRQNAARFVPVMDDYVQAQKMAIESQLNMNSAQEANVRILTSLKSQLAGVRAEWDRLVVNKGGAPGALLGGDSIGGRLTTMAAASKNLLRLLNGDDANLTKEAFLKKSPLTYGSGFAKELFGAWRRASGQQGTRFLQAGDILANLFQDPMAEGRQTFQNQLQQLNAQSGALAMRGRLMDTIANVLPMAKGESQRNMIEVAASQMQDHGAALQKAIAGKDTAGAQELLRAAAEQARKESLQKAGEVLTNRSDRLATLNLSLQNVNAEVDALTAKGAAQSDINSKLQEQAALQKEIHELESDRSVAADAYAREAAEVADVVEMKQKYLDLLKEEEQLTQGIAQLAEQQTLGTAGSRLDAQVNGLTTTIELLKQQKEILDERGGAEDVQAAEELRKQIAEAEARKAALESPRVQAVTSEFDRRQIAARRAREEADSYGVGFTESEKLLNQERGLRRAIGGVEAQPFRTENDRVRLKELEIQLWQNQEKIQTRIVELAKQEKQLRIDASREFQKNLLLAGPGEQMQRLYVSSLASRKLGSGEFNALSPELKRMYFELMGGDAGAKTREEQGLLRGRRQSTEQEQSAAERARARVAFSGRLLDAGGSSFAGNRLESLPGMKLPTLDPLVTSGKAASEQLNAVAGSASAANAALMTIPQTIKAIAAQEVNALMKGFMGPMAPKPKLDVQSGYALGAAPVFNPDRNGWSNGGYPDGARPSRDQVARDWGAPPGADTGFGD